MCSFLWAWLCFLGGELLVRGMTSIAHSSGLSPLLIGLVFVSIGTSTPELPTSVTGALKGSPGTAVGNVVGRNIFNIFNILVSAALVSPIPIPKEISVFDLATMLGATTILVLFAMTGWRLNRWEGGVFLAAYATYLYSLLEPNSRTTLGLS